MIRFWEEEQDVQSSKRLTTLSLSTFAMLSAGSYLIATWDYVGFAAIFSSVMTVVITIIGIGKKQENDRAKINKETPKELFELDINKK